LKKILVCVPVLLITTALIASLSGVARAIFPTTSIEIVPSSVERLPGNSFIINVTVNDFTGLYLWMFRLRWNHTVLQLNSIEEGPFLKKDGGSTSGLMLSPPTISEINSAGKINELACSLVGGISGVDGSGTITTLNFTCLAMGSTALEFWEEAPYFEPATELLDSNGDSISHIATPGTVNVIPEFSDFVLTAVFLLATLFVVALGKKVHSRRLKGPQMS